MIKTKTIKVNNVEGAEFVIELKEKLSWGEQQDIEEEIIKGAKVNDSGLENFDVSVLRSAKYKTMEVFIVSIKDKEEKKIDFSKEWIDNLSSQSGDMLYSTVNQLSKKKD